MQIFVFLTPIARMYNIKKQIGSKSKHILRAIHSKILFANLNPIKWDFGMWLHSSLELPSHMDRIIIERHPYFLRHHRFQCTKFPLTQPQTYWVNFNISANSEDIQKVKGQI